MILQLLWQFLSNLGRCSASFCFGLSLRFPCPLPKRISSRMLSKSMFIPKNHPKSQQRVRTCTVKEKPVFRASLALSMLEIELYQISHVQWQSEIIANTLPLHIFPVCCAFRVNDERQLLIDEQKNSNRKTRQRIGGTASSSNQYESIQKRNTVPYTTPYHTELRYSAIECNLKISM